MTQMRVMTHEGKTLVYNSEDVEGIDVKTLFGSRETDGPNPAAVYREPTGENSLELRIAFKRGRRPLWVDDKGLDAARAEIRREYLASIPDAYAGSLTIKEHCWQRVLDAIDLYAYEYASAQRAANAEMAKLIADAQLAAAADWNHRFFEEPVEATVAPSDPAPTMSPAPEPSADPGRVDSGEAPQQSAARPIRGRKRTTPAQPAPTTPETESGEDATP